MTSASAPRAALLIATLMLTACAGPKQRVILLPDPDGHVGVIEITTESETVQLAEAFAGARVRGKNAVSEQIGEAEVKRRYGGVIGGLPSSPKKYILNFEFGTDELTPQSLAMIPRIRSDLRGFPAPEVVITGHTDTLGVTAFNDKLSRDRANRVRDLLVKIGIPRKEIETIGRGDRDPLVPAKPGAPEPRNRRVEIKLR